MAIDTPAKRRSSAAARRMPWMRRFLPAPDGTIDAADRQQGAWVYGGIEAGAADVPGYAEPEFTITRLFPRTQTISRKFGQTQSINRLHPGTLEVSSE